MKLLLTMSAALAALTTTTLGMEDNARSLSPRALLAKHAGKKGAAKSSTCGSDAACYVSDIRKGKASTTVSKTRLFGRFVKTKGNVSNVPYIGGDRDHDAAPVSWLFDSTSLQDIQNVHAGIAALRKDKSCFSPDEIQSLCEQIGYPSNTCTEQWHEGHFGANLGLMIMDGTLNTDGPGSIKAPPPFNVTAPIWVSLLPDFASPFAKPRLVSRLASSRLVSSLPSSPCFSHPDPNSLSLSSSPNLRNKTEQDARLPAKGV